VLFASRIACGSPADVPVPSARNLHRSIRGPSASANGVEMPAVAALPGAAQIRPAMVAAARAAPSRSTGW
jgi:hypothetical protein